MSYPEWIRSRRLARGLTIAAAASAAGTASNVVFPSIPPHLIAPRPLRVCWASPYATCTTRVA